MLQQQQQQHIDGNSVSKMTGVEFVSQQNGRITFHTNQTVFGAHQLKNSAYGAHQLKQRGLWGTPTKTTGPMGHAN
jgi:hypothetical protein